MRSARFVAMMGLAILASTVMSAASAQSVTIVLRGGTVHPVTAPEIPNGTVVMQNGRITAVGVGVATPPGAEVIDITGLHVYPGMFDAVSQLGLTEIGAVDVTNDSRELGQFNPHLFSQAAVHPASEHIPVARANGITHAATFPAGPAGGLAGQASVISLDGWTVEEMLVAKSVGVVLSWPSIGGGGRFGGRGGRGARPFAEMQREYNESVAQLEEWISAARQYDATVSAGQSVRRDLKLEALATVTRGELPFLVGVDDEDRIRDVIAFAERTNVRVILIGASQAWKVADEIAAANIPVILGPTQTMPSGQDEGYDEAYTKAAKLYAAGVTFAFSTQNSSDSRVLPYEAGHAVGFGLPWDAAIKAVTINAAEIYGLDADLGSIEVGKIANLMITSGDPLEIRTTVHDVIIGGIPRGVDNKHLRLYEKYRAR